ncbi:PLP-dependent aminotransferase family protein [Rhodospirillum sp. A1_3_36]|uniref:aminotransferase-like domain-containing protein n=1 Tax=Rhodospirillum sp. A1_3_36 TaxID=3391666 RepID=UPI0039A44EBC
MAIWTPSLTGRRGPKYRQILDALTEEIEAGTLVPGMRLPPHRDLAYALGVSANTTSRAYAEGVARALLRGEVGRGTYVRELPGPAPHEGPMDLCRPPAEGPIDLSRNLPAPGDGAMYLAQTLAELSRGADLRGLLDYQTEAGQPGQVVALVRWLEGLGVPSLRDEVVITIGAQHGILATLMAVTQPGDLLATEALTYAPLRAMARRLGLRTRAVAMDGKGLSPQALDALCREASVRALYLTPTFQTPTGVTLEADRRAELVAIARRHDLLVIEDDVFGSLAPVRPPALATLAPERTIYLTSLSKCLGPGLRVGMAKAPKALAECIRGSVTLSCWMPPPLMAEVAACWIREGSATRMAEARQVGTARRRTLAREVLGGLDAGVGDYAPHVWLVAPEGWTADSLRAEAARRGVWITEGAAFATDPATCPEAVRICLGHEADEGRLRRGLACLRDILSGPRGGSSLIL